ncbi:MAG: hypothetical protein ABEN55_14465 [Bradymonadaceae bacterium]
MSRSTAGWFLVIVVSIGPGALGGCVSGEADFGNDTGGTDTRESGMADTGETDRDTGSAADTTARDATERRETGPADDGGMDADGGSSANLLANARFERGGAVDACPSDWTCKTYAPEGAGQFSVVDQQVHGGELAARWSGEATAGTLIKQSVPSAAGKRYEVAVWVRGENLSNEPFLEILFDSGDEAIASETFAAEGANDGWTQITGTTRAAPDGTNSVRFNLSIQETGGSVQWDSALLVEREDSGDMGDTGVEEDTGGDHRVTVGGGGVNMWPNGARPGSPRTAIRPGSS